MGQASPGPPAEGGSDGRRRAMFAVSAVLAVSGATAMAVGLGLGNDSPPAPPALSAAEAGAVETAALTAQSTLARDPDLASMPGEALGRSLPTHLTISRVGIDTDLMELGLAPDGSLQVPPDDRDAPAGWYGGLASPGEIGPAVIVGHLDAPDSPAVFYNLGALRTGDRIGVTRADGAVASFRVREVGTYPREYFPTAAVYGPSPTAVLRLVTCGGAYSRGTGYTHNIVVFADLVGTATASESDAVVAGPDPTARPEPLSPSDPSQSVPGPPPEPVHSTVNEARTERQVSEPVRRQYRAPQPQAPPPVRRPRPAPREEKPEVEYIEEPSSFDPRAYD